MTTTTNTTTTTRDAVHAIPYGTPVEGRVREFMVMVAHAGRSARSGAKVHMAQATLSADGQLHVSAANCSANGHLRGSLVRGRDFSAVTCKRCNGGDVDAAARRNAVAITL